MSQQQMEQQQVAMEEQQQAPQQPEKDEYAEALDMALSEDDGQQQEQQPAQQDAKPQQETQAQQAQPAAQQPVAPQGQPQTVQQPQYELQPQQQPVPPQQNVQPEPEPQPQKQVQPPKKVTIPDGIKEDFEKLKAFSPEAAAVAEEDSIEGQQVRDRLKEYGADLAYDRASVILNQRGQQKMRDADQQEAMRRQAAAHDQYFRETIMHDHPDYAQMVSDPNRAQERQKLIDDIFAWIQSKPYSIAAPMMQVAQFGRDPHQVSELLKLYKQERGNGGQQAQPKQPVRKPDPTAALAVPGRGGTVAPAGVGDKDDFDAALDAGLSSEK